jgi:3-hydroxyacyl-CoA dehydrogenase
MFYADTIGLKNICDRIETFQSEHGAELWKPAPLLKSLSASGGTFADWDRRHAPQI